MPNPVGVFSEVVSLAAKLNEDTQALLAKELRARIAELTEPQLTNAERVEVKRCLDSPRHHVNNELVREILEQYRA